MEHTSQLLAFLEAAEAAVAGGMNGKSSALLEEVQSLRIAVSALRLELMGEHGAKTAGRCDFGVLSC